MDGMKDIKTVEDLKAAYPVLVKQITADAESGERKRIQEIENVALAGFESIVSEAKFSKPVSAGEVAMAIVAAQKQQAADYIEKREDDAKNGNVGKVAAGSKEGTRDDSDDEIDALIDRVLPEVK